MFVINSDKSIHLTRGDVAVIQVGAVDDGQDYTFKEGDLIRLRVFEKKQCNCVVLQKDVKAQEGVTSVEFSLSKSDTKIGGLINKPVDYWYEIELNPDTNPQTILGYDDEGPKIFRLYPEGGEVE